MSIYCNVTVTRDENVGDLEKRIATILSESGFIDVEVDWRNSVWGVHEFDCYGEISPDNKPKVKDVVSALQKWDREAGITEWEEE